MVRATFRMWRTGGKRESLYRHVQHLDAGLIELGILMDKALGHLGIAVDSLMVAKAFLLYLAGTDYALTNGGRWLARLCLRNVLEGHGRYFDLDVDACCGFIRQEFLTDTICMNHSSFLSP